MDGLSAVLGGFDAVAVYGQGGFKPDWAARFAGVREVVVCYDRDATLRAVQVAKLFGERGRVALLPRELGPKGDLNDLLVRCGGDVNSFRARLAEALRGAALPLEVEIALVDPRPITTLRERIAPLLREVAAWPDPLVQEHLLKMIAERCGVTLDSLRRALRAEVGRDAGRD
jgi:DNA primase